MMCGNGNFTVAFEIFLSVNIVATTRLLWTFMNREASPYCFAKLLRSNRES